MNLHTSPLFLTAMISSFSVFGSSLLTDEEQDVLKNINLKYSYEDKVGALNDSLAAKVILQERMVSLGGLIDESEAAFSSSTEALTEKLSKGSVDDIDELYSSIKKISTELALLKKEREEIEAQISNDATYIKKIDNELNVLRSKNSRSLQDLRKIVLLRLQKNASTPSNVTGLVSIKCRATTTLDSCVSSRKNRELIINELLERNELETSSTKITNFSIDDAIMKLDGSTSITASMTVQGYISDAIRKKVDKTLGLSEVGITIASDVQSDFYVDGVLVGKGLTVSTTVPSGSHGVYVSHSGQHQSAVISTHNSDAFYFPFDKAGGKQVNKVKQPAASDAQALLPPNKKSHAEINHLFIGNSGNTAFFIPTHSQKTTDTFYSGDHLQGIYTFDVASKICHTLGKKAIVATDEMYAGLLTNRNIMSIIGVKSSFWISPQKVVTIIGGDLHYKNVGATEKYNVLCMMDAGGK